MNNQLNNDQDGKRPDNKDPRQGSGKNHQSILAFLICLLVTLVCFALFTNMLKDNSSEISYDKFIDMVDKDQVKEVTIQSNTLTIVPKKQNSKYEDMSYYTTKTEDSTALTKRLEGRGIKFETDPPDAFGEFIAMILSVVLPTLLLFGLLMFSMRRMNKGGGIMGMGVGKSKAKAYVQKETGVTFKDVAGQDEAKESLQEVVDFLHNPGKYTAIGAKLPKGALLVGPPGTGKTLLAKAVAGEAQVPFFSLSGSEFVEMFVGVGASRVRDLFEEAKKNAPCIIFIDEIDAIGKSRDSRFGGGNDEREQTLNQLLVEMDGFAENAGIIILAATNRPDVLDKALLRPGRFDYILNLNPPLGKTAENIVSYYLRDKNLAKDVQISDIVKAMPQVSCATLETVMNLAAINSVYRDHAHVQKEDIIDALLKVVYNLRKADCKEDPQEHQMIAVHEAAHAVVGEVLHSGSIGIITIRGSHGAIGGMESGFAVYAKSEEEFQDEIIKTLAGKAGTALIYGIMDIRAAADIKKADQLLDIWLCHFAGGGFSGVEPSENRLSEPRLSYNEAIKSAKLEELYRRAYKILYDNRDFLLAVQKELLEHETLLNSDLAKIRESCT